MRGGEQKGFGMALWNRKQDVDTEDAGCGDEAMFGETALIASIRDTLNETMAKAMSELKSNPPMKKAKSKLINFCFHFYTRWYCIYTVHLLLPMKWHRHNIDLTSSNIIHHIWTALDLLS